MQIKLSIFARSVDPNSRVALVHDEYDDDELWADRVDDYVRISDPFVVNVKQRPAQEIVDKCVKKIDEDIDEIKAEAHRKVHILEECKRKVLLLEYTPE